MTCLEKSPDKRPTSALELWRQLGDVVLRTPWTPELAEQWWREHLPELTQSSMGSDSASDIAIQRIQ